MIGEVTTYSIKPIPSLEGGNWHCFLTRFKVIVTWLGIDDKYSELIYILIYSFIISWFGTVSFSQAKLLSSSGTYAIVSCPRASFILITRYSFLTSPHPSLRHQSVFILWTLIGADPSIPVCHTINWSLGRLLRGLWLAQFLPVPDKYPIKTKGTWHEH